MNYTILPNERKFGFQHYNKLGQEFKVGFEGEKLVYDFFKEQGFNVIWSKDTIEVWDLIINGKWIDVKTVGPESHKKNFLLPIFQGIKNDFYIGVKLPGKIYGFLSKEEVKGLPVDNLRYCYSRYKLLTELNNIDDLITILRNEVKE